MSKPWLSLSRWFKSRAPLNKLKPSSIVKDSYSDVVIRRTRKRSLFRGQYRPPRPRRAAPSAAVDNNDDDDDDDDDGSIRGGYFKGREEECGVVF
jgi:hypothetical protein